MLRNVFAVAFVPVTFNATALAPVVGTPPSPAICRVID